MRGKEMIGRDFLQGTKYSRKDIGSNSGKYFYDSSRYKQYNNAKKFPLPKPTDLSQKTLMECVKNRRSRRNFASDEVGLEKLSYILWVSDGISKITPNFEYRTAPSAGALYPIETYLVINRSSVVPTGIFHWNIPEHSLELIREGDFAREAAKAALDQTMVARAPVVIIWTAVFSRSTWKYKERAYRYVFLDAGHIAAQLFLGAVSVGCGTCQIAAFYDDEINKMLEIDGINESALYLSVLGKT